MRGWFLVARRLAARGSRLANSTQENKRSTHVEGTLSGDLQARGLQARGLLVLHRRKKGVDSSGGSQARGLQLAAC